MVGAAAYKTTALAARRMVFTIGRSLVSRGTLGSLARHCNMPLTNPCCCPWQVSILPQGAVGQTLRSSSEPRGLVRDNGAAEGAGAAAPARFAAGVLAASWVATPGVRGSGLMAGVEKAGSELGEIMGLRLTRMAE